MEKYFVARPTREDDIKGHQAKEVYSYLKKDGSALTFAQILSVAYQSDYRSLLDPRKTVTVPESLCHHLGNFRKKGLIKIIQG
jgi:hypothetical protein